MKLRRGDRSAFITRAVIRPLVERGYLTWRDAGWTGDPAEGGTRGWAWYDRANQTPGDRGFAFDLSSDRMVGTINRKVQEALIRFQQDNGIHHTEHISADEAVRSGRNVQPGDHQVSSGVVGRRTLKALGTDITSPETQRLIAMNMRRQAAEADITTKKDGAKVAQNIAEIRNAYPNLDARVTAALALTDHGLEDPVTKTMVGLSMKKQGGPIWTRDEWADIPHEKGKRVPLVDALGNQIVDPSGKMTPFTPKEIPQDQGGGVGGGGPLGLAAALPAAGLDVVGEGLGIGKIGDAIRTPIEWTQNEVVKPAARAAFTALETPYQAVQGEFRNQVKGAQIGGIGNPASYQAQSIMHPALGQSTGGIALEKLAAGEHVDLGSGYFPGGQIAKQQAERARSAGSIDGHALTPGRYFASLVTQPGTVPYNLASGMVDAAAIMTADPANYLIGGASEARETAKLVQLGADGTPMIPGRLAGLIPGVRRSVHAQTLDTAMESGVLAPLVRRMALAPGQKGSLSYNELRRIFKGDAESAALVSRATSVDEVRNILDPRLGITNGTLGRGLGTTIRDVPKTYTWRRVLWNQEQKIRAFGMTPGRAMNLDDINDSAEQFDRVLRSAKLTAEQRNDLGTRFVLAEGREDRFKVITEAGNTIAQRMIDDGVDKQLAKEVGTFWKKWDEDRIWLIDLLTGEPMNPFVDIGDARYNMPHPGLDIDFMNNYVPLPDIREVRRLTSDLARTSKMLTERGRLHPEHVGYVSQAADASMRIWRGAVLARPAILGRVGLDEQARMAATGYWDHPWQVLTSFIQHPKDSIDSLGRNVWDEAEQAMAKGDWTPYARARSRGWADWDLTSDERLMRQRGYRVYKVDGRDARGYVTAWQEHYERLHASEVAKHLAAYGPDDTKAWLAEGGRGHGIWNDMTKRAVDMDPREIKPLPSIDTYVDNLDAHLIDLTQHDQRLRDVIATGNWEGKPIARVTEKGGTLEHSKEFRDALRKMKEDDLAPAFVPGPRYERIADEQLRGAWDKAMNLAFDWFMTRPTNRFARSPVFHQAYWKRMEELLPGLGKTERAVIAKNARKMGYGDEFAKAADRVVEGTRPILTHVEADRIAKSFALDETKNLLYDVGERTTIFDTMRNFVPFGEAWKEVVTRWSRIMYEHPENLRRLQVAIDGARGADPLNKGHGFFYTDPTTGDESFVWPGSEWLTDKVVGQPIPITGSVSGLNMIAQGLPGVGPAVQVPVGWVLPDEPDYDWIREAMDPYGSLEAEPGQSKLEAAVGSLQPPWFRRLTQVAGIGPEVERARATMSMASYLKTAHPNWSNERVVSEAKSKSRAFWFIRMLGSGILPTAPIVQFQLVDKHGRRHGLNELKSAYYEGAQKAQAKGTGPEWDKQFIAKYGLDTYGELAPMTDTAGIPLPRTKGQYDWVRKNEWAAKKYPYVYGFFVPPDPGGTYDPSASNRQLHAHERFNLSPEEQRRTIDDRKGWAIYNELVADVDPDDYETKREIRKEVKAQYPGWMDRTGLPETVNRDDQLAQLRKAIKDPKLRKTDFAAGMRLYLQERDALQTRGERLGYSPDWWKTSKRMARARADLRDLADTIRGEVPETGAAFDSLFRSELEDQG